MVDGILQLDVCVIQNRYHNAEHGPLVVLNKYKAHVWRGSLHMKQ